FPLGEWDLALAAARPGMGGGALGPGRRRVAVGARLLGRERSRGAGVLSPAAGPGRCRSLRAGSDVGQRLRSGELGLSRDAVCLAAGLLVRLPAGTDLGPRP